MHSHASVEALARVAERLGPMTEEVVFVGGSVVGLLVPDAVLPMIRATDDVDCVVNVVSTGEYYKLSSRLKKRGFSEVPDSPVLCRWVVDDILVDVMPSDARALGFSNRWYSEVLQQWTRVSLPPGLTVRVVTVPLFLATKFEAFEGRGNRDYLVSHDIEDVVTVVAFRDDVVELCATASRDVQDFLRHHAELMLEHADVLSGYVQPDDFSQSRLLQLIVERFKGIRGLKDR